MNEDESLTIDQAAKDAASEDAKELDAILKEQHGGSFEGAAGVDPDEPPKKQSKKRTVLFTVLFIVANVAAILVTALMDFGGKDELQPFSLVWGTFKENGVYALIALGLFVFALLAESAKRYVLLRSSLKHKKLFRVGVETTVVSKYYDFITPFGSGGQPMEIYHMRKRGVPGPIASGISVTCYALGLFATVFITIVMLIWKGFLVESTVVRVMAIIGLVANVIVPLGVLVFSTMPKVGEFLSHATAKIAGGLRISKNVDKFRIKALNTIKEYSKCIIFFFSKYKWSTLLVFFLSVCYNIAIYSIPYFVIRLCGIPASGINYFEVLTLCLICFSTITFIPTPGNSGAAEISFYSIFSEYLASLGSGILFWGVLSWRIYTYYSFILIGFIFMIVDKIIGKRRTDSLPLNNDFLTVKEQIHAGTLGIKSTPPDIGGDGKQKSQN